MRRDEKAMRVGEATGNADHGRGSVESPSTHVDSPLIRRKNTWIQFSEREEMKGVAEGDVAPDPREESNPRDPRFHVYQQVLTDVPPVSTGESTGTVLLRNRLSRRESGLTLSSATLGDLLNRDVGEDIIFETGPNLIVLDLDSKSGGVPGYAEAVIRQLVPAPAAAWVSHDGQGVHALYQGTDAYDLATLAALTVPPAYEVEILHSSRHPRSADPQRPEARCGPIRFFEQGTPRDIISDFLDAAPEDASTERDALGLAAGQRYDHDKCPIAPHADSTAKDCVVVYESHVVCYRCLAKGIHAPGASRPGIFAFGGTRFRRARIVEMARGLVHFVHADFVIAHDFPNLSRRIRRRVYRLVLCGVHGEDDPRIPMAFNPDLLVVRGDRGWLDLNFRPTPVDANFLSGLPACYYIKRDKNGDKTACLCPVKVSNFKHRSPRAYPPLSPFRGILFGDTGTSVPVRVKTGEKHEVKLLREAECMPETEVHARIEAAFPKISIHYLRTVLAAAICASAGAGQPPMLACLGPSGAGKGETIRLAESFLADEGVKITLAEDLQNTLRQIGDALASGTRIVTIDEVGKYARVFQRLTPLLQLGAETFVRSLYANGNTRIPTRAAFYFPTTVAPDCFGDSAEFARRIRLIRLHQKTENWYESAAGDTKAWRDRSEENARAANSMVTEVWSRCRDLKFDFIAVADAFELPSVGDEDAGLPEDFLKALYRYARNECGNRALIKNSPSLRRGWCDLNSPGLIPVLGDLAPGFGSDAVEDFKFLQRELCAVAWSEKLGIREGVHIEVKQCRKTMGFRFVSDEPCLRGRERINEELPPLDAEQPGVGDKPTDPNTVEETDGTDAVNDILLQGGLL